MADDDIRFPAGSQNEKELLLQSLGSLRASVLRKLQGLDDARARWTPDGKLIPLVGIVHHLTLVEWRSIERGSAKPTSVAPRKNFGWARI